MRFLKVVLAMAALGSCGMGWTQIITVQSEGQRDALVAAQVVGIPSGLFVLTDQVGQAELSTLAFKGLLIKVEQPAGSHGRPRLS